jgi:hypothetical protein
MTMEGKEMPTDDVIQHTPWGVAGGGGVTLVLLVRQQHRCILRRRRDAFTPSFRVLPWGVLYHIVRRLQCETHTKG